MLKKFVKIKNVAKFHDFAAQGDIEFREVNLIFAENGKGKSTLASICHSLSIGDPSPVIAKITAGVDDPPEVEILFDEGLARFIDSDWDKSFKEIVVFDLNYINNNIFSGDHVTAEHRRKLYYLVVGDEAVRVAQVIEDLDTKIKELNRDIKNQKNLIQQHNRSSITFDEYLAIEENHEIEDLIKKAQAEVHALEVPQQIAETPLLLSITLPQIDFKSLRDLLGKTIENIEQDVEARFKEHTKHIEEDWIRKGIEYEEDDQCPFCRQALTEIEIIKVYRQYFSEARLEFKNLVNNYFSSFESQFSEDESDRLQRKLGQNEKNLVFWKTYLGKKELEEIGVLLKSTRDKLMVLVDVEIRKKSASIFTQYVFSKELDKIVQEYIELEKIIQTYNATIEEINVEIKAVKDSTEVGSIEEVRKNLLEYENKKDRFLPRVIELVSEYLDKENALQSISTQKAELQQKLKDQTGEILDKHSDRINELLEKFGLNFKIINTKTSFQGRKANTTYDLEIEGQKIPLGTVDTVDKPSFKTTLSEGEKSSLAFAFFLTQLEQDSALQDKIVILDDPITSLDGYRKECTRDEIVSLAAKTSQIVVMSHDPFFLKLIKEKSTRPKTLHIQRYGTGSVIGEWNIEEEIKGQYFKDYEKLKKFIEIGDAEVRTVDAVRCIRPIIEGNLRVRFPDDFLPDEWLGDFIKKIAVADKDSTLHNMEEYLDELTAINDFSKKFHHDVDPNYQTNLSTLGEGALTPWAKRTIAFINGL